jgi:hypothetical protein
MAKKRKPPTTPKGSDAGTQEVSGRQETAGNRTKGGRWAPGNKAGKGRPKGSRNRVTLVVEELLEGQAEALTQKLISRAMGGSTEAMKIIFGILAPPRKDRPISVALPQLETLTDLVAAHGAIIKHVASGEVSPSEGHALAALLELRRRAVEDIDFEARLAALEARQSEGRS